MAHAFSGGDPLVRRSADLDAITIRSTLMLNAALTPAAFDPGDTGTPESAWRHLLATRPIWEPQTDALVIVSPHPDDEVLAAGGLIHSWSAAGRPVTVVSVTDGEAAFPRWRGLAEVRRRELNCALRKLSLAHVSVIRLGIADGRVARHANRLRNALLGLLGMPITLVVPYERDGHPDHEAVGDVCCAMARTHQVDIVRYPIWAWHHMNPAALGTLRWGRFVLSPEAQRAKSHAIQCFESQLRPPFAQPVVPSRVLPYVERPYEAFLL